MSLRIFCTIFLIVSACAFPLYFTIAIGLFALVWFHNYYEIIPICFLNDIIYGESIHRFHNFPLVMTFWAVVFTLILYFIKKQISSNLWIEND